MIVSVLGLAVTVGQWTRPAILKRREKWLRESLAAETNEARTASLRTILDATSAQIIAGVLVPGWRFILLAGLMLIGPAQAFVWARNDPSGWGVISALAVSVVLSTNPIRRGVRLLAERYRVAWEYLKADRELQTVRTGLLNGMEGGTRLEMLFGFLASLAINALAIGVTFFLLDQQAWGTALGLTGAAGAVIIAILIHNYARKRVSVYGPWSVEDPAM